jgi:phosphoribosylformimino-5-aminoimidazole carboxamide ribotide isomerase
MKYACVTPASCRASTSGAGAAELKTNFVSDKPSSWFAELYQKDQLTGGHVIMLGADEGSK